MKRGFALSINTLVVVILGIVLLGGGFLLITKIVGDAEGFVGDVDISTQKKVNVLLTQGELLAIPDSSRDGGYESHVFVMGFSNRFTEEKEFIPVVKPVDIIERNGTSTPWNGDVDPDTSSMPLPFMLNYSSDPITLQAGERKLNLPVKITIESGKKGTYTYRAQVLYNTNYVYAEKLIRINVI